jgi:hypothetical protein
MAIVHPNSCECTKSELDLFEVSPTQTSAALKNPSNSMSSLISSPRKYRISFPDLVYVIILVSFRIIMMSWFHSRDNSFRFLQWTVATKKGLNSLYVYCPLVELRMVGDAQVPLLRIVPVEGRDGEMITWVFDPIQYCPLDNLFSLSYWFYDWFRWNPCRIYSWVPSCAFSPQWL